MSDSRASAADSRPKGIDRRTFVQSTAALAGLAATATLKAADGPKGDKIRLGIIGVGNRGDQLLEYFKPHKDAEFVAVCDAYEPYMKAAVTKIGGQVKTYSDYRELLKNKDIDAVVIATPDHWHARQCIDACEAGKDVYVEKPISLTIDEGKKMVEVAEKTGRVVGVGLQRRSGSTQRQAVEAIQKGEIGHVTMVRCFDLRNEFPVGIGAPGDCDPPAGLNWDMWLGPAPKVAFNPNRCFYKFRWFWDYSGGQVTNMATHYIDIIQWALGQDAPETVYAVGGKFAVEDNRETPDTLEVIWRYPGKTLVTFSEHNANEARLTNHDCEIEFQGTKGTLYINKRGYDIVAEKNREAPLPALSPTDRDGNVKEAKRMAEARKSVTQPGGMQVPDHTRNFLDCLRTRKPTNCPISVGHRSSTATLLANISLRIGRQIRWDAVNQQVIGDEEANGLLSYKYRDPWPQV